MRYIDDKIIPTIFPAEIESAFGTKLLDSSTIPQPYIDMLQVHGTHVERIYGNTSRTVQNADGLLSSERNVSLITKTADCVPILFYDPHIGLIGASHQGWKGTHARMQQTMINNMIAHGAAIDSILVSIGPAIGPCCYEVFGERKMLLENEFSRYKHLIFDRASDRTTLNLCRLNYELLKEVGIKESHIEYTLECTACHESLFSSYNRDTYIKSMDNYIRIKQ